MLQIRILYTLKNVLRFFLLNFCDKIPPAVSKRQEVFMAYSKDIKQQVFEGYLRGCAPKELSEKFSVPKSTVYNWCTAWKNKMAGEPLSDSSVQDIGQLLIYAEELKRQLEATERELTIIHESSVIQTVPLAQRIDIALSCTGSNSNTVICQALEIDQNTFYYHKRFRGKRSKRQEQECCLCGAIRDVYEESGCRFGAERIRLQLQKQGIVIGKKRIISLMKKMRLPCGDGPIIYYPHTSQISQREEANVKIL